MKTLYSLIRQPVKTLAGVLLIAFAITILIVSAGQFASTVIAKENLSDGYSTVAVISDKYFWKLDSNSVGSFYTTEIADEDTRNWAENAFSSRKDLFLGESFTEVYSAYIPQLSPDVFIEVENERLEGLKFNEAGFPYRCAMLEITLDAIGTLKQENVISIQTMGGEWKDYRKNVSILCSGTVNNAISLERGFASPIGMKISFLITVYDESELESMHLEVGQRYLLYGMDYTDSKSVSGQRMSVILEHGTQFNELFGPATVGLNGPEYEPFMESFDCFLTVCDYASLPIMYSGENGFEFRSDLRETNEYKGLNNFLLSFVSADEFMAKYSVPTIVKLEGTAEEFLNSDTGAFWKKALNTMEITNHGFPVFAVDKLGYQMAFARVEARIVEGRDFTEEERKSGAKVCIVSDIVAKKNDLSIGDTLSMQTYVHDYDIKQNLEYLGSNTSFPLSALYSPAKGFTSEAEEYTVVGIYRQNNAWENTDDPYGFTPNTIFVPKGSITGDVRTGSKGIFYSIVLHNGKMEELQKLQNEAGYPDLFLCFDQGYTEIAEALDAYEGVSQKAFYIGIAGCAVILILFLVLFPLQQGKNLDIMCSLGAPRGKRIGFILGSSLGILLPGALLGGTAGALLWKKVAEKLMESVHVTIPMSADTVLLSVSLTGSLLLGMLILVTFLALIVSGEKGLIKRK